MRWRLDCSTPTSCGYRGCTISTQATKTPATLIIGLAKTGLAVAEVLRSEDVAVSIIDDGPLTAELRHRIALAEAIGATVEIAPDHERCEALVVAASEVVPSPGVRPDHPVLQISQRLGRVVRSEIDLAAQRLSVPIVAVSGTNGKTTTVELITAMLRAGGLVAECGGNIGTPLISLVHCSMDVMVAEVSSFQLEFTTSWWHPRVAVLLNVADDHLDWHGSVAAYVGAKAKLFAHQRFDDVLVVNDDDAVAAELTQGATGQVERVSIEHAASYEQRGERLVGHDRTIVAVADLRRGLPHDLTNALCASAAAVAAMAILGRGPDDGWLGSALKNYETLPHRVQFIGENLGVRYYDDSKATNPHATLRAVDAFDSVVLLAGGLNKGLDLGVLRAGTAKIRAVVAFGQATDAVVAAFDGVRPVTSAATMAAAVRAAADAAKPGDVVLLSPGCASFDMYPRGYVQRGEDFSAEVRALIAQERVS